MKQPFVSLLISLLTLCLVPTSTTAYGTTRTAFSVLVTDAKTHDSIAGAKVKVGDNPSKLTNANGVVVFNLYFDGGAQTLTVTRDGYKSFRGTVSAEDEGRTIPAILEK